MSRDIRVKLEWNIHGWTGWRRAARKRGKRSTTSCINGLSVSDNDNHVHRARRGGGGKKKKEKKIIIKEEKREELREGKGRRSAERREGRNDAKKMGTRDITFVVSMRCTTCAIHLVRTSNFRESLKLLKKKKKKKFQIDDFSFPEMKNIYSKEEFFHL